MNEEQSRWDEIRKIQIESATAYRVLGGLVLVGILILIGKQSNTNRSDFDLNLFTEIIGVAITVLIIDTIYSYRDERRRDQELKDRLLSKARSPLTDIAQDAFHEMMEKRLIYDKNSILICARLTNAQPRRVALSRANLKRACLVMADFSGSAFNDADLESALLSNAILNNTEFRSANLKNADLEGARLDFSDLTWADLEGANLMNASIENPHLYIHWVNDPEEIKANPQRFRQLILPDKSQPDSDQYDLSRFTDPNHAKFWRSEDPESPAYRGHYEKQQALIRRLLESDRPPENPPPTHPPPAGGDSG